MQEIWKDIPIYDRYEVSNFGRIRAKPHVTIGINGRRHRFKQRVLKPCVRKSGLEISLVIGDNNAHKVFSVHRLVAKAFLPKTDRNRHLRFLDGDKHNARASNLEWVGMKKENAEANT